MTDIHYYLPKNGYFMVHYDYSVYDELVYSYRSWNQAAQHLASFILEFDDPKQVFTRLFSNIDRKGCLCYSTGEWNFPAADPIRKVPSKLKLLVESWMTLIEKDSSHFLELDSLDPTEVLSYMPNQPNMYNFYVKSEVSGYRSEKLDGDLEAVIPTCLHICGQRCELPSGKLNGNIILGKCGSVRFKDNSTAKKVFKILLNKPGFTDLSSETVI